jgi:hypothetical protein
MEQQNNKRIKIFHQSEISSHVSLNEINDKLNHINTKLVTLDNKINQIGNMSSSIVKNNEHIKREMNKIIENNEVNKSTLLTEIKKLQMTIIQKLLANNPISNDMLSAYS